MSRFIINDNKGFSLVFANNIAISVQFGPYNYCEHQITRHKKAKQVNYQRNKEIWESEDAEIAIIRNDTGEWWNFDKNAWGSRGECVKGFICTNEVASYIAKFSKMNLETHDLLFKHKVEE